ncbi:molybdopterin molybdotransferase MoeA [Neptunomonas phycophila]|uniref:Molybdopterin molybdenumtransferase n=1 Tax=Neptunomonas phycophila TaxID=1572645 RepID=A0ABT9EYC1_9GAMM|nr:gephyrin-like molybdotransferase Glp [Neptunomonas phycophila]MDP2524038.1 molybdopterin molybdotransferase MoeA [Neptunomonas phycophila]
MASCDQPGLIPYEQALAELLREAQVSAKTETVKLEHAVGRVLAEQSAATVNVPPADNSSMDGYAVDAASIVPGVIYPISQRVVAGHAPSALEPGAVARIFTGAEIPEGANAVVMQEAVTLAPGGVIFGEPVRPGQYVRKAGQDIKRGDIVIPVGTRLQPADIGVLASTGNECLDVFKPLKVAILSTGDELVDPGQPLESGQIYNSNRYVLMALLKKLGMEPVVIGRVQDSLDATVDALLQAAELADCIISTGGVSVGEEDHVRQAVEMVGHINIWRLKIKPGKPLAFGRIKGIPFFGLPGNPASTLVTFCILARPFLLSMQGIKHQRDLSYRLPAGFYRAAGSRQEYVRVRLDGGELVAFGNQNSGVLSSASWADGLAVIPSEIEISKGDMLTFLPFTELLG